MSLRALYVGGSGMLSQSSKLGVLSNNIANITTDGFKKSRANFEDTLYQLGSIATGGAGMGGTGVGITFGSGARVSSTQIDFAQGPLRVTGRQLDVAIGGKGFFEVADAQGNQFYTRAGNFSLDSAGQIIMPSAAGSFTLQPGMFIPADATAISISPQGVVSVEQGGELNQIGQIQSVRFVNPEGLSQVANNLYAETGASGPALQGEFTTDGFGVLHQGFLEASNVEPVTEVVDMIINQQAFELNAQVFQASSQRLQIVTELNR